MRMPRCLYVDDPLTQRLETFDGQTSIDRDKWKLLSSASTPFLQLVPSSRLKSCPCRFSEVPTHTLSCLVATAASVDLREGRPLVRTAFPCGPLDVIDASLVLPLSN